LQVISGAEPQHPCADYGHIAVNHAPTVALLALSSIEQRSIAPAVSRPLFPAPCFPSAISICVSVSWVELVVNRNHPFD
jgi:hypothetical protein